MTKANPQPSTENKTQELVCLEIWFRIKAYKIKNSTYESCNRRDIPYMTTQVVPCEIQ